MKTAKDSEHRVGEARMEVGSGSYIRFFACREVQPITANKNG
jgi:hypothetical protein